MRLNQVSTPTVRLVKVALGGAVLAGLAISSVSHAKEAALPTVDQVNLTQYAGTWYEVARKPMMWQKKCDRDVTANYSLNEKGNVTVDNRCYTKDGELSQSIGEAYVQNAPQNSKLKVSFLPKAIRWLPVARGDYWVLKIDSDYQTVLVGEPSRKYLWVLSRDPKVSETVINEYLEYAKQQGYDLSDLIRTQHTAK